MLPEELISDFPSSVLGIGPRLIAKPRLMVDSRAFGEVPQHSSFAASSFSTSAMGP